MDDFAQICITKGLISQEQYEKLLLQHRQTHLPLDKLLLESGYLNDEKLSIALSTHLHLPLFNN